ncbi:MAG: hypothetical protein JW787_03810 [Sedimentisphaerales bacterium]|nr:hypothetical protein [Sedimentisphaerales bacterium]
MEIKIGFLRIRKKMTQKQKNKIRNFWQNQFKDLNKFRVKRESNEFDDDNEVLNRFSHRQLAGLYAVASICYHGNEENLIEDVLYDRLCKCLLKNYKECIESGADMLDKNELRCCSGIDTTKFVKPYHDIAEILLGHECRCLKCTREHNPNLN